jgi:hypothetical protein
MRLNQWIAYWRRTRTRTWSITIAATLASTYALDAIASAAGLALAASGLLASLNHAQALIFLAATYVTWAVALRVNLHANWALLEETGTSTNALSKLGYDIARGARPAVHRLAAHAGYVVTEVGKEIPYYAGAFGAVIFTDSVSATDAVIFLGGANMGAAIYEYGLARLVRAFLGYRQAQAV